MSHSRPGLCLNVRLRKDPRYLNGMVDFLLRGIAASINGQQITPASLNTPGLSFPARHDRFATPGLLSADGQPRPHNEEPLFLNENLAGTRNVSQERPAGLELGHKKNRP